MTKAELQHDPLPGATEKQVLRRRHGRVTETRDMVAAEVPVAFACNGEPFAVMMATPDDLEDFAFGFALAEGHVAGAGEGVIEIGRAWGRERVGQYVDIQVVGGGL